MEEHTTSKKKFLFTDVVSKIRIASRCTTSISAILLAANSGHEEESLQKVG